MGEIQISQEHGRVTATDWSYEPVVSDFDAIKRAMEAAIRRADSAGILPRAVEIAGLPAGTVRLAMEVSPVPLSIGVPAGVVRMHYLEVTRDARPLHQAQPIFPELARQAGLGGAVTIQYVITDKGTVPSWSARVIRADHQLFAKPAIDAILASTFEPARSGKCRIGLWVQQTIVFHVEQG